jgi:organic radical activating enzyme
MELLKKIEKFNKTFENCDVFSCESLQKKVLALNALGATFCCSSSVISTNGSPTCCTTDQIVEKLDKSYYIDKYIDYFYELQLSGGGAQCKGCIQLRKMKFTPINYQDFKLWLFNIANFHKCNVKCVYCDDKFNHETYNSLDILKKFIVENCIDEHSHISHAYGEPTIHRNFNECFNLILQQKAHNEVYSSGLFFSEIVYNGLKHNKIALNISVDAGTPETYKKIKSVDGFNVVWKNISKYCEASENIEIKYIVFSYNSSKKDLDGFIQKCVESNVKRVIVSGEHTALHVTNADNGWFFRQNEIDACAYLLSSCQNNGLISQLNGTFPKKEYEKIMSQYLQRCLTFDFSDQYSYCIFGLGVRGRNLYECITKYTGIKIDYFCDNHKTSQGNQLDIPCINVKDAVSLPNVKIIVPVGQYYREMVSQLHQLGFQNYILLGC